MTDVIEGRPETDKPRVEYSQMRYEQGQRFKYIDDDGREIRGYVDFLKGDPDGTNPIKAWDKTRWAIQHDGYIDFKNAFLCLIQPGDHVNIRQREAESIAAIKAAYAIWKAAREKAREQVLGGAA